MENEHRHHPKSSVLSQDIRIWLDSYDDLFSDFDSRPYSGRVLSDDFIHEIRKVCGESEFSISELRLLLPEKIRNMETENIISRRLHTHFRKNHLLYINTRRKLVLKALTMLITGLILMLLAAYVGVGHNSVFWRNVLFVILEPAGWFLVWSSLDELIYSSSKKRSQLGFYAKMSESRIIFESIG